MPTLFNGYSIVFKSVGQRLLLSQDVLPLEEINATSTIPFCLMNYPAPKPVSP